MDHNYRILLPCLLLLLIFVTIRMVYEVYEMGFIHGYQKCLVNTIQPLRP